MPSLLASSTASTAAAVELGLAMGDDDGKRSGTGCEVVGEIVEGLIVVGLSVVGLAVPIVAVVGEIVVGFAVVGLVVGLTIVVSPEVG